jgi:hypothetical protein
VAAASLPRHLPDLANGQVNKYRGLHFRATSRGQGGDQPLPSGGAGFRDADGTFIPTSRRTADGSRLGELISSMRCSTASRARHALYSTFPYVGRMNVEDVLDLRAWSVAAGGQRSVTRPKCCSGRSGPLWRGGSPAVEAASLKQRRITTPMKPGESGTICECARCSECHAPRNLLMVPITAEVHRRATPAARKVPSLYDLVERSYKDADDLAAALQFGETFGYDHVSSGGMGAVRPTVVEAAGAISRRCRLSGELEVRPDPIPRPLSALFEIGRRVPS